jgi:hypothetical protein
MAEQQKNPLSAWYRQPKIYIKLPSDGDFYPPGTLDKSESGEYPVYAMTAKDELMFKTPDALLSGQSTVEVIKSCVPAIIDPWKMPSLDVDAILMAIRIATYGEDMEVSTNCPSCDAENDYILNLTNFLNSIQSYKYESVINCDPLTVYVRPYTYQEMTKTSLKTFEQQRIFSIINDDNISEEKKLQMFGESFVKLTELTVDIIAGCISKIQTPDGETSDPKFIKEFLNNAPKDFFEKIANHVTKIKENIEIPPQQAKCKECEHEFKMPVTMDQSNFFAVRS